MNRPLNVLLLGYGGANNTGAEIRVLTIIDDVRAAFGDSTNITLATLNREKTLQVVSEAGPVSVEEFPHVFPLTIWRLTKRHDIVLLVEGSTFKDSWSSALLYLFLWGAWSAKQHKKAVVAYAVDAGRMRPINQWLTRKVCGDIDLVITRTEAARNQLRSIGVSKDIAVTTDTAFQFRTEQPASKNAVPTVGIAPVEFYEWPVKFRLWGPKEQCYHWPYYFSWDRAREAKSRELVSAWVDLVDHIVIERGWNVQLVAMEELDKRICEKILSQLPQITRSKTSTAFAGEQRPQEIVRSLRSLDYLVTSRYHACVLSMAGHVPQMALYHDERLISIYREMGIDALAISNSVPKVFDSLAAGFNRLVSEAEAQRTLLAGFHSSYYLPKCLSNRDLLTSWAEGFVEQSPKEVTA